jgi:glutaconate CoA-transferase subunit B
VDGITVGFLGGAQVDRYGNLNSTVIGDYAKPKVRPSGQRRRHRDLHVLPPRLHRDATTGRRSFVPRLDFLTSLGHGPTVASGANWGVTTEGPSLIVTDLCTMRPDPESKEFEVVTLHPGSIASGAENTDWPVRFAASVAETPSPSPRNWQLCAT